MLCGGADGGPGCTMASDAPADGPPKFGHSCGCWEDDPDDSILAGCGAAIGGGCGVLPMKGGKRGPSWGCAGVILDSPLLSGPEVLNGGGTAGPDIKGEDTYGC